MDQMMLTYIITGFSGVYSTASIIYYVKNKRFLGRYTLAFTIIFIMGMLSIERGIPITKIQYLIESFIK